MGNFFSFCGQLVLLPLVIVLSLSPLCESAQGAEGDDLLTVAELKQTQEILRQHSRNVQGTFKFYRCVSVVPATLDLDDPDELDIPLVSSGELWRSAERFRVNINARSDFNGKRLHFCGRFRSCATCCGLTNF